MAEGDKGRSLRDRLQQEQNNRSGTSVFENPELVDPETIVDESRIVGRDEQVDQFISLIAPALDGQRPQNMLLYGSSGTGKSLITGLVANEVQSMCEQEGIRFGHITINCQGIDSEDQAAYRLVHEVADQTEVNIDIPKIGISTDHKFTRLYELIDEYYDVLLFSVDEIDLLQKPYSGGEPEFSSLLYRLTRIGEQQRTDTKCAVAALSNNPSFMDKLDGRAESSFNPTDIEFSDYGPGELRDILHSRSDAFVGGALSDDVIPLCSAFGAQNHGDARKAIELFRRAGKVAENQGSERVLEEHVRQAESDVDKDRTKTLIKGLASQKKYCLYAIAASIKYSDDGTTVSEVANNVYRWITDDLDANEVTGQTYRKYVKKLETCQLISVRREGQGRGKGIRAEYELNFPEDAVIKALIEGDERLDLPQDELESVVVSQHNQIQS